MLYSAAVFNIQVKINNVKKKKKKNIHKLFSCIHSQPFQLQEEKE